LSGARFELDSRIKLATRQPPPIAEQLRADMGLPEIGSPDGELVRDVEQLGAAVREHHPSVELHEAIAARYRRMVDRAHARRLPRLRFVDVSYGHRTDRSRDGVGGQLAFDIPFGGRQRAEIEHFEALGRQQRSEANALVADQISLSLQALNDVHDFESRAEQWRELERLALDAEQLADRWWKVRLAKPTQVSALLDNAYAARIAVLEARERAANAGCTLLAMTGISLDAWPRQ
jgi:outer membrane protein TolC